MKTNDVKNSRRTFIGTMAVTAGLSGLAGVVSPLMAHPVSGVKPVNVSEADEWFKQIKGKRRVVYDATQPHDILPFAWPRVFLLTNEATGTPEKDCSVVVVLRHDAIPYAMESGLWEKYHLGEVFHAPDPRTGEPATRNPFWKPKPGDFQIPGFGEVAIGIDQLQESGVMFCVCDAALTVYSAALAEGMGKDATAMKEEWVAGLLPNIQVVPSGVWALGRAQEHNCAYIFAG
jgi:intracellular sulfur oxidation DsrE/DsrF family protein